MLSKLSSAGLGTGHSRLLAHLSRLGQLSPTDEWPCSTSAQTPEHLLQPCPTFDVQRSQIWHSAVTLHEKLWVQVTALRQTADLCAADQPDDRINMAGERRSRRRRKKRRKKGEVFLNPQSLDPGSATFPTPTFRIERLWGWNSISDRNFVPSLILSLNVVG